MKHLNISKRTPIGHIPLCKAIKLVADTLYDKGWDDEVPKSWQPFQLITRRTPTGELIRKEMIRFEMGSSSKGKQIPKKTISPIDDTVLDSEEFGKKKEYSDSITIAWKKIRTLLEQEKLRIKISSYDFTTYDYYTNEDVGNAAWLYCTNKILHTGCVPIGRKKNTALWGTLFLNKSDVLSITNKIEHRRNVRARKRIKKIESSLAIITDTEMKKLREYLEYLVDSIKERQKELFRNTMDNKPWILLTHPECDNFLKALSQKHSWKYNSEIYYKKIKNYEENGVNFLKNLGIGLKGKQTLNLQTTDKLRPNETRIVAFDFIQVIQTEICKKISAE